jgi:uncharacterized membrane protein
MIILLLALLIGVVAGLRAFTAPAAISWAARLGWLPVGDTPLAFMGYAWMPWLLTALALVEFVTDQLPRTPSRTVPMQFGTRIIMAGLSGGAIGTPSGWLIIGGIAGIVGVAIVTLGGHAARARLAAAFRRDAPAAFIEDAVAIFATIVIVMAIR